MVADRHRGLALELLLVKLLQSPFRDNVQIIGMSATMGGAPPLAAPIPADNLEFGTAQRSPCTACKQF